MSLEERLGQLLVVPFHGRISGTESPESKELLHLIRDLHVGGLMLHTRMTPQGLERGGIEDTAALINECQKTATIPLIVAADFEHGTAMRLEGGTSFPHAMGVAAAHSPLDAYEMGRITATEALTVGIHWIFAPVADVNSNPDNPIVNTRSFGENPRRVSEFVSAFIRGVNENGALATAKHFPGHGDSSADSHLELPRIRATRKRLASVELVPFRAAIDAGVSAIMTGHLSVPALEPDPNIPATLSRKIVTGLLRRKLKFRGLVVTDAMDMAGISARYSAGEAAVLAILAGVDVLLLSPEPDQAVAALREAVVSGRLPLSLVNEKVRRILQAKAKVGLHKPRLTDLQKKRLTETISNKTFTDMAQEIADRGVTLLRNSRALVPLNSVKPIRALLVSIDADPVRFPGGTLEREIRWRLDSPEAVHIDAKYSPPSQAKLPAEDSYDVVLAAVFVRVADRKGNVSLPAEHVTLVERLLSQKKPIVVVCFGSPYLIERFPNADTWLAAFSTADVAQKAAARALFGEIGIGGKLPVSVPGARPPIRAGGGITRTANPMTLRPARAGHRTRLAPTYAMLDELVNEGVFPGGVIAVGCEGEFWLHAFGRQTYSRKSPIVATDTIYDVASLTKPVVTTTLVAMDVEAGHLNLDVPLGTYLPEWNAGPQPDWRKRVTLRHLLTHTSGLPGHVPYYETLKSKKEIVAHVLAEPLTQEPGSKAEYSDPGFILLGEIVERVAGKPLNELAQERIFTPLEMRDTLWNPPRPLHKRIAPSGDDSPLRNGMIRGEVHDDNAWAMVGVAGHAGLFSTASDLAVFCQMMLNGGTYAHHRLFHRATVGQFTKAQPLAGNTRALGWVVPTEPSASGKYFSSCSFGHSGYTGTSLWCDPEKNVFVVLLTNRTYPTRTNEKIQQARPAIHDSIMEALGFTKPRASAPIR